MEKALQLLAEHLAPPQKYVDRCKEVTDKLFKIIQSNSRYDADRCRIVGGLEKKTSTSLKVDADLVIFVNVEERMKRTNPEDKGKLA